jgi:hypothetical protein
VRLFRVSPMGAVQQEHADNASRRAGTTLQTGHRTIRVICGPLRFLRWHLLLSPDSCDGREIGLC